MDAAAGATKLIRSRVLQTSGPTLSLPGPTVVSHAIWLVALSQEVKEHQINSTH